jgi:hypothetical protein
VIIQLTASTTTRTGLRIQAGLDPSVYEKGLQVSDQEMAALAIERSDFHGDWDYLIKPRCYLTYLCAIPKSGSLGALQGVPHVVVKLIAK